MVMCSGGEEVDGLVALKQGAWAAVASRPAAAGGSRQQPVGPGHWWWGRGLTASLSRASASTVDGPS
jgi:hypothetical protein